MLNGITTETHSARAIAAGGWTTTTPQHGEKNEHLFTNP